jgi:hypothetical protein
MKQHVKIFLILSLVICLFAGRADAIDGWVRFDVDHFSQGRVIGIAADTYVIDIGLSGGSSIGKRYLVYEDAGNVLDANGALLGSYKIPLAVLKVHDVATSESFCKVDRKSVV